MVTQDSGIQPGGGVQAVTGVDARIICQGSRLVQYLVKDGPGHVVAGGEEENGRVWVGGVALAQVVHPPDDAGKYRLMAGRRQVDQVAVQVVEVEDFQAKRPWQQRWRR